MSDSWRDLIDVHPAAECSPLLSEADLEELADDIEKNGLQNPPLIVYGEDRSRHVLLDGRNRLDALERLGYEFASFPTSVFWKRGEESSSFTVGEPPDDPYAVVMSLNAFRRHLTAKQKRDLVAKLAAAQPEKSNRAIAKMAKVSDKTVGAVRGKMEARAEIPHVSTRTDAKGRQQPARRRQATKAEPEPDGEPAQETAVENLATEAPDAIEAGLASPNGTEVAAEPIAPLELSTPTTNGAAQPAEYQGGNAEISGASGREHDELAETLRSQLRRDPAVFLSDVAAIMGEQPGLLLDIPETSRLEALNIIRHALGLAPRRRSYRNSQ